MNFFLPAGTDWSPYFKMLNNSLSPIFHLSSDLIPIPNQNHSFRLQLMSVELYDPYETNLYCYSLNIKWLAKFVICNLKLSLAHSVSLGLFQPTLAISSCQDQLSSIYYKVSNIKYQVTSINYKVSIFKYKLSSIKYELSSIDFK